MAANTENSQVVVIQLQEEVEEAPHDRMRAEIDTSAPFESVKEAAHRFGGMGFWRPPPPPPLQLISQRHGGTTTGIVKVEEQAEQLEKDLIAKEKETLDVLIDLENNKNVVREIKLRLQSKVCGSNVIIPLESPHDSEENTGDRAFNPDGFRGFILQELQQAKLNLSRTTDDLASIRATLDLYKKKIDKDRILLENTCRSLSLNTSENKTENVDLQCDPINVAKELQKLSSETEEFKKLGEAAKSKVLRAMSETEQTKTGISNADIGLVGAKRMKEAAKTLEAVALAEIKALSKGETEAQKNSEYVTLTLDEESVSNAEILKKVGEVTEEVKANKKALQEVLSRVEAVTRGKLEVEDALRKWKSKHSHKRRSVLNSNSNRLKNLANDEPEPVEKPRLSIGQILSRKLLLTEDYENGIETENIMAKNKVSLGQMLGRRGADFHPPKETGKENCEPPPIKQKKFGIARLPILRAKQSNKEKKCITEEVRVSSSSSIRI